LIGEAALFNPPGLEGKKTNTLTVLAAFIIDSLKKKSLGKGPRFL
jgi:hypothetical protein